MGKLNSSFNSSFFMGLLIATATGVQPTKAQQENDSIRADSFAIHTQGHSSLLFEYDSLDIYVDPWSAQNDYSQDSEADYVFITHLHPDHFDTVALNQLVGDSTVIVGPQVVYDSIQMLGENNYDSVMVMNNWDSMMFKRFSVWAVPAYNLTPSDTGSQGDTTGPNCPTSVFYAFHFDEGSGDEANNSAGPGSVSLFNHTWTSGKIDSAVSFNGIDSRGVFNDTTGLDSSGFTIEFWFNLDSVNHNNNMVFIGLDDHTSPVHGWIGAEKDSVRPTFILRDSNNTFIMLRGDSSLNTDEWYHIAAVRDNSNDKNLLYLNGELVDSTTVDYTGSFLSDEPLTLGFMNYDGTSSFYSDVAIDELYIHDTSLSADTVMNHYTRQNDGFSICEGDPDSTNTNPEDEIYHPEGEGNGYVFTFGEKRVYIGGDTENIPEMDSLGDIDIAFLPMNLPYTMTPEMAADAARKVMPDILYIYHFGESDTAMLRGLLAGEDMEIRFATDSVYYESTMRMDSIITDTTDIDTTGSDTTNTDTIVSDIATRELEETTVFPNPVDEVLSVDNRLSDTWFYLFDMNGRLVMSRLLPDKGLYRINLGALSSGNYIIKLRNAQGEKSMYILKE